jgi:hypothetical protein
MTEVQNWISFPCRYCAKEVTQMEIFGREAFALGAEYESNKAGCIIKSIRQFIRKKEVAKCNLVTMFAFPRCTNNQGTVIHCFLQRGG